MDRNGAWVDPIAEPFTPLWEINEALIYFWVIIQAID